MYNDAHEREVMLEVMWREYISSLEDITIPYYKVMALRDKYNAMLDECEA